MIWHQGYKPFFVLSSTEHEIYLHNHALKKNMFKCQQLLFISKINITSECFEQEKDVIFSVFYFQQAIEISCSAELSMKKVL